MHEITKMVQEYLLENFEKGATIPFDSSLKHLLATQKKKSIAPKVVVAMKAPEPKPVAKKEESPKVEVVKKMAPKGADPLPIKPIKPSIDFTPIYQKIAPMLKLYPKPPSDVEAKRVKEGWKREKEFPATPLFVSGSLEKHAPLLKALSEAIDKKLSSCRCYTIDLVEKENGWDSLLKNVDLKLILIPNELLESSKNLQQFIKNTPSLPLLLLGDLEIYNDPNQKKLLWQQIVERLT